MAWVEVLSGLGRGGHISTPHDSTQSWAEQRSTLHQLLLYSSSSTTVLLTGPVGLAVHQTSSVKKTNESPMYMCAYM
jgi:hypothetical protein